MIREEVASLLREKNMKRKNIKEEDTEDPVDSIEKGLKDKVKKANIDFRTYQLNKAKK